MEFAREFLSLALVVTRITSGMPHRHRSCIDYRQKTCHMTVRPAVRFNFRLSGGGYRELQRVITSRK